MPISAATGVTVPPLFAHAHSRVVRAGFQRYCPRNVVRTTLRLHAYFLSYPNVPPERFERPTLRSVGGCSIP